MIRLLLAALAGLALFPSPMFCIESCTWINSATASGILGGPVEATVTHSGKNKEDGTCEFTRSNGATTSLIYIEVLTGNQSGSLEKYRAQCMSPATSIQDFGNEAMACAVRRHGGNVSDQIFGHVRDRAFLVRIVTSDKSADPALLREEARSAAGQVVGNLF